MSVETEFVTIQEAVEAALEDWHSQGVPIPEMEELVDAFVGKALDRWRETPSDKLPVSVSGDESRLISGAVLNALADWHSGGGYDDPEEMEIMAEEFALEAIETWKNAKGLASSSVL